MVSGQVEYLLQQINGKDKEHERVRVPLPKATTMPDGSASDPIEHKPRGRSTKQGGDAIPKSARKSTTLEKIQDVLQANRIKRLSNVEFAK